MAREEDIGGGRRLGLVGISVGRIDEDIATDIFGVGTVSKVGHSPEVFGGGEPSKASIQARSGHEN